jgi:hypothetical protein
MKQTQINDILIHLQKHLSITPKEAVNEYDCYRLAAVVLELRKHHIITTEIIKGKTKYGRPSQYATYYYWGKKENAEKFS